MEIVNCGLRRFLKAKFNFDWEKKIRFFSF